MKTYRVILKEKGLFGKSRVVTIYAESDSDAYYKAEEELQEGEIIASIKLA